MDHRSEEIEEPSISIVWVFSDGLVNHRQLSRLPPDLPTADREKDILPSSIAFVLKQHTCQSSERSVLSQVCDQCPETSEI